MNAGSTSTDAGGKLTFETDKLVALSGLAKRMHSMRRDTLRESAHLAGLWRENLEEQLLWCRVDRVRVRDDEGISRRSKAYIAPSW
jgi:hypothetical protein